ncbi:hypothetical protein JOQ06_027111 [Pogonophryne albipinna]|uniref:RING-type domain-containing protein n=1 Tax=Pogonophryne albipinna TaxID=1090488 RepID=A0AAD6BDK6_9TELE|nr:hypothetical protein JOQ06_027111 [Pogonophryne albipinna]
MAGEIFTNLDNLFNVDCANVHPLVCHMCHEQYRSPCLLDCYHIFCARCLRGRINDNRLSCPLCGGQHGDPVLARSGQGRPEWLEQLQGPQRSTRPATSSNTSQQAYCYLAPV